MSFREKVVGEKVVGEKVIGEKVIGKQHCTGKIQKPDNV